MPADVLETAEMNVASLEGMSIMICSEHNQEVISDQTEILNESYLEIVLTGLILLSGCMH